MEESVAPSYPPAKDPRTKINKNKKAKKNQISTANSLEHQINYF